VIKEEMDLTGKTCPPPFSAHSLGSAGSERVDLPLAFKGTPFVLHFYNSG